MKVTYSISVASNPNISSAHVRVLTENMLNNDKLDVHFSNAIYTIPYKQVKQYWGIDSTVGYPLKYIEGYFARVLRTCQTRKYLDEFLNTIKGDYLVYSICAGMHDYPFLAHALNNGVRVIAGGTDLIMHGFDYVRKTIRLCGAKEESMKNLMLLRGNATPHLDLVPYMKRWKDDVIHDDDLDIGSCLYAKRDYLRFDDMMQIKNICMKSAKGLWDIYIWPNCLSFMFNSKCLWGKCNFCTYCLLKSIDWIENLSVDQAVEAVMGVVEYQGLRTVVINDDYFRFHKKHEQIVKELKDNGCHLVAQTGVSLLKNEEYTRKFLDTFHTVSLGLEWAVDSGLKYLNKGFKWEDALKAFDNIKKHYKGNIITNNIIMDGPVDDVEEINLSYRRLAEVKRDMESHGMMWAYTISIMSIFYDFNVEQFLKTGRIRIPPKGKISGRFEMLKLMEQFYDIPEYIYLDGFPYERIDKNGNSLESDLYIADENLLKEVTDQSYFYELLAEDRKVTNEVYTPNN